MKKQINDLLLKMQNGENCIGETANQLLDLFAVSRSLLLKIEKDLGDTKRQFLLWHDGGEWIVSLNGDMKQCKTLSELVCRNDG